MPQTEVLTRQTATGQEYNVPPGSSGQVLVYNPSAPVGVGWGSGGSGTNRQAYQFGRNSSVPNAGTLQLLGPGTPSVGFSVVRAGTITGGSISVDTADGTRSYNLDIRKNGVSVATIALATGNSHAE